MKLKIYDIQFDNVIKSFYITAGIDYEYALKNFVPLINKLDFQRSALRANFYKRLESDILEGCIMPNLTFAIKENNMPLIEEINENYIEENLINAFVLDGIQRLNTLKRIANNGLDLNRMLYCNILVCNSMDKLLYRMITLNNGQKPMTARHQIEILASNIFDFDNLPILTITEKEKKMKIKKSDENTMNKENLIKGYVAFISSSVNIDNQKIIEEKMNELIVDKILESNIAHSVVEFKDVIEYISNILEDEFLNSWFNVANNFIGFCAAMTNSFNDIVDITKEDIINSIKKFEKVFSAIDVSKIKLGTARRRMVQFYFNRYSRLSILSESDLLDIISQEI